MEGESGGGDPSRSPPHGGRVRALGFGGAQHGTSEAEGGQARTRRERMMRRAMEGFDVLCRWHVGSTLSYLEGGTNAPSYLDRNETTLS
jgi:hypothetical protein